MLFQTFITFMRTLRKKSTKIFNDMKQLFTFLLILAFIVPSTYAKSNLNDVLFSKNYTTSSLMKIQEITETDSCSPEDSLVLVTIYNNMNGSNWKNQDNWLSQSPVKDWWGITVEDNRVTKIDLTANNLSDSIPTEIGDLTDLSSLRLDLNKSIRGSIPETIGDLTNLNILNLERNQLKGNIPPEIGNLTKLTFLNLSSNELKGLIPSDIGNLMSLNFLNLSGNHISGAIPPEIGNLTQLQTLKLEWTDLTDTIPTELCNLANLKSLELWASELTGPIPPEIGNLTNLNTLNLGDNNLRDTIPSEIGNLTELTYLNLARNQLIGSIPDELGNLKKLERLKLYYNQLSGEIPLVLSTLNNLTHLLLGNNELTGFIPPEIGNLNKLEWLDLGSNNLKGSIPPELGSLTSLRIFFIFENQFDSLPDLSALNKLQNCRFRENYFDFGDLETTGIDWSSVDLYDYAPQGKIPKPDTTLSGDQLTLTISDTATKNQYIWYKDGEAFDTTLTNSISVLDSVPAIYYCKVTNDQYPDLTLESEFLYTGTFKHGVVEKDYRALVALYDSTNGENWDNNDYWLSDSTVNKWYGITVENHRVTEIVLNNNNLSDSIPSEIGNLTNLSSLNLRSNYLSGEMPPEIGNLTNLTSLRLSNNELNGSIPQKIGQLSNLKYFYIYENKFDSLPDLSVLSNLDKCIIAENHFDFGDLETFGIDWSNLSYSRYTPQNNLPRPDTTSNGDQLTFTVNTGGTNNQYIWVKDSSAFDTTSTNSITITDSIPASYYCKVTNDQYPNLTLQTDSINLFEQFYTVTFNVTDASSNSLEGVTVNVGGVDLTTNMNGVAMIDTADGTYDYTISMKGYDEVTGSITISGSAVTENVTLEESDYTVTFNVTDANSNTLEGATVSISGIDLITNSHGVTTLNTVNGTYNYTVSMAGYDDFSDSVTVSGEDITEKVTLSETEYTVIFYITDEDSISLENAKVSIGETIITTHAGGVAELDTVSGNYDYTVSLIGYDDVTGNVTVSGGTNLEEVTLSKTKYTITFKVSDENNNPLESITITIGGVDLITGAKGTATLDTVNGSYDYLVTEKNYKGVKGFVNIDNADVVENVKLSKISTGMNLTDKLNINIYPNPAFGKFVIDSERKMKTLKVMTLEGEVVDTKRIENKRYIMETGVLTPGMYLLRIRLNNSKTEIKRVMVQ